MTLGSVIVLAIVQGLTEFFPVSSSGHLAVFPYMFGMKIQNPVAFDIFLHLGTLGAVVLFLWRDIMNILHRLTRQDRTIYPLLLKILIALIPAMIAGLLFNNFISSLFEDITRVGYIGYAFLGTALLLFLSILFFRGKKTMETFTYTDALIIGIFQALALVPGFSRSGFTLFGALVVGLKRKEAFKFSFLISIPVILGAALLELREIQGLEISSVYLVLGFMVALFTGLFALIWLKKLLGQAKLWLFGLYCALLGVLVLGLCFFK